tara:strand:+ start:263 stop:550 length:288 start_codon:yes stop_codon:yes gene_type:complete
MSQCISNVIERQASGKPIVLSKGTIKRVHVNMHVIRANKKNGTNDPCLSVKTSKGTFTGNEISIDGQVKFVYSPDKPLSCGARVWAETRDIITLH